MPLSLADIVRHFEFGENALVAASTAEFTSASSPNETWQITSSFVGFIVS